MIRYASIISESLVDGLGLRVVAFLQGCPRRCEGCHNQALLSTDQGEIMAEDDFAELLLTKISPLHKGITFSGGDPLAQPEALQKVIHSLRLKRPNINIWVYTGFSYEEVSHLPLLGQIDVLIDGPFVLGQRDLRLPFRGSSNQRIIDIPATLTTGKVTEIKIESFNRAG